ncbi:Ku protein [Streptomyces sp. bgisy100]|uniref:non-homologous end joining protein Ku n=1 Tax=Streptomyces sp. bgisy100 TaxID=3413783 RepID=UPI003D705C3C
MRSIWKGSISFGLVNIPIKVFGATESHSVSFRQVHLADNGRIRYRKVCELDDEEVPNEEIVKAYEAPDGSTVPLTDEDLAALPLPTAKTIEILAFVPAESIDPLQLERSYYLGADGPAAAKPYVLLREALTSTRKVAVAKFALRGRETLGMLRVIDDALAIHTLLWPDEIRPPEGMVPETKVTVREAELDLADTLMDTLGELEFEELHDEYREAVEALVAAKLEGTEPEGTGERPESGRVIDLMSALEKSVRVARGERGAEDGEEAEVKELRPARGTKKSGTGGRSAAGGAGTGSGSGGRKSASSGSGSGARKSAGTSSAKSSAAKSSAAKASGAKTSSTKTSAVKSASAKASSSRGASAKASSSRASSSGAGAGSPKAGGGKKSTSTARSSGAKSAGKTAAKSTAKSTAKSAAASGGRRTTAANTAGGTAGKKTAAKKTAAKKRASA